jgi:hypothetical protein
VTPRKNVLETISGGHANNWNRFFAFPQESEQSPPGIECKTSTGLPDVCVWIGGDGGFSTKLPPDPETGEVRTIYPDFDYSPLILEKNDDFWSVSARNY